MPTEAEVNKFIQDLKEFQQNQKEEAKPGRYAAPPIGYDEEGLIPRDDDARIEKLLIKRKSPVLEYCIDTSSTSETRFVPESHKVRNERVERTRLAALEARKKQLEAQAQKEEE